MEKTFLVTVTSSWDADKVKVSAIHNALNNAFYSTDVIVSVVKHDPESEIVRNKIPAIKRIRELLKVGLKEAKHIADMAEKDGLFSWMTVTVIRESQGNANYGSTFKVIDNS